MQGTYPLSSEERTISSYWARVTELADSLPLHDRTQRVVRYREHLRLNESVEWKQVEAAYAHLMPTTQQNNGIVHTT